MKRRKYYKNILFILLVSLLTSNFVFSQAIKPSELPIRRLKLKSQDTTAWIPISDSGSLWSSGRISLKDLRDSSGGGGDTLPFGILARVRDLDTLNYHRLVNKPTIFVRETRKNGFFNITPKNGRAIDSVYLNPVYDDTSSVWELKRDESESINFNKYGVADGVTDNKPLFRKALNAAKNLGPNAQIFIPAGNWFFADSIGIKQVVRIHGARGLSICTFASGKNGFVFFNAESPAGTTDNGAADNSEIDHLVINQKTPYVGGFAIKENCTIYVHDITFNDWGLYAVYINAGAISSTLWGKVRSVMIAERGDTTRVAPTVTFGGTGTLASGTAILGFGIASCNVTDSGRNYYSTPSIKVGPFGSLITEDNIQIIGTDATAFPLMGLDTIYMINQGSGYTQANTHITITNATAVNPTAVPIVSGGKVIGATVLTRGRGFDQNADIHIAITGDGTGATAFGTMLVVGIAVTNAGGLYESNVALFFTGGRHGTGHDAEGTAIAGTVGRVKRVQLNNGGDGYGQANTTVTFSNNTKGQVITNGAVFGNANRWKIRNINVSRCLGAVWTEGGDANVGLAEEVNALSCRGYGVEERSFLGSEWSSCHTELCLGSYRATSNTGVQTLFKNCYGEGGQFARVGLNPAKMYGGDRGDGTSGTMREPLQTYTGNASENGTVEFIQKGPNNDQTIALGGPTDDGTFLSDENSSGEAGNKLRFSMDRNTGTFGINFSPASPDADLGLKIFGRYSQRTFGNKTPQPFTTWVRFLRIQQQGEDADSARLIMNSNHFPNNSDGIDLAKGDWIWNRNPNSVNKVVAWSVLKQIPADSNNRVAGVDYLPLVSAYGFTDTHIGNTDLQFTGDRLIHVKNFNLTWDSTLDFKIVRQSASSTRESLQRWFLSDGGTNQLFAGNTSPTNGVYNPAIGAFVETGTGALTLTSLTTAAKDSVGGGAMINVRAAVTTSNSSPLNGTISNIINKDVIRIWNGFGTSLLFGVSPLGKISLPAYNSASTITGTANKFLAVTTTGDVIPAAIPTGTGTPLTLTTNNTSGAATYNSGTGTLNIPIYSGGASGTITLNAGTNVTIPEAHTQSLNGSPNFTINVSGLTETALTKTITLIPGANIAISESPTQQIGDNPSYTINATPCTGTAIIADDETLPGFTSNPNSFSDFTFTVSGVSQGDAVTVGSPYPNTEDWKVFGYASATNTVKVRVKNFSAATILFTGMAVKIRVIK